VFVIPAIDLIKGRCVRFSQGRLDSKVAYSAQPVSMAKLWKLKGARALHIVDLDGAFEGRPKNLPVVARICQAVDIPVQLGGGIRSLKAIKEALSCGVKKVILGSAAYSKSNFLGKALEKFGQSIVVSIDARDLKVAIHGWSKLIELEATVFAREVERIGVAKIIFTDIGADGMLKGPNLFSIEAMLDAVSVPLIVAGGISSMADVGRLKSFQAKGLAGVIIGKALYAGKIELEDAIALAGDKP